MNLPAVVQPRRSTEQLNYWACKYTEEVSVTRVTVEINVIGTIVALYGCRVPLHIQCATLVWSIEYIWYIARNEEYDLLRVANV